MNMRTLRKLYRWVRREWCRPDPIADEMNRQLSGRGLWS